MELFILFIVIIFILLVYLSKFIQKNQTVPSNYPYEFDENLLSKAERSFFGVLNQAVKDEAVLFSKVRVADILKPQKGMDRSRWQKAFNRISSKHFDYVVCRPDTLSIICVVELDDKSHSSKRRKQRDEFLDNACAAAGLRLYRFKTSSSYNVEQIRDSLFN